MGDVSGRPPWGTSQAVPHGGGLVSRLSLGTQSRNHQVRRHPPNLVKHQRIWDPKRAETLDPSAPAAAGDSRIQGLGGVGGWVEAGRAAQPTPPTRHASLESITR
mgnify:CR=1 FL=1